MKCIYSTYIYICMYMCSIRVERERESHLTGGEEECQLPCAAIFTICLPQSDVPWTSKAVTFTTSIYE